MRFFQIITFVALVASVGAVAIPTRRSIPSGQDLEIRDPLSASEVYQGVKSGLGGMRDGIEKIFKELMPQGMPHMEGILKKMQPGIDKALQTIKHPEDLKLLEPKIHQVILSLQPEFKKAVKGLRPVGEVLNVIKHKFNEGFEDLKDDLKKVWENVKPGLDEAMDIFATDVFLMEEVV
jgi:hypothetical protein